MTPCPKTASIAERLKELRGIMAKDDTHFLEEGYKNLADRCMNSIRQMANDAKRTAKKSVPYFWRGFKSPCGSSAPRLAAGHTSAGHGHTLRGNARGGARGTFRGHCGRSYHPYQRW
jgi:hypothetical protein